MYEEPQPFNGAPNQPGAYATMYPTVSGNTRAFAKKRLTIFLAVTFVLSWGTWIPAGFALDTFTKGEASSVLMVVLIALGMFYPLIGALVANRACGQAGRIDLCVRPRIRGNVRFYLIAWFGPALLAVVGSGVFFAANPHLFDPTLSAYIAMIQDAAVASPDAAAAMPSQQELAAMAPMLVVTTVLLALTIAPFINAIPAFGEEAGWRGMLFPTLCELMSTRSAAIVSGIIWGIWHAPAIAMGHNYGMDYLGFPWTGILVMAISCTAMGVCFAYLRLRTQSVWPCALAHGAFNAIANTGVYFCLAGQTLAGPSPLGFVAGIPLFTLGAVCWILLQDAVRAR